MTRVLRCVIVAAGTLVVSAAAAVSAQAQLDLTYGCSPPSPSVAGNCPGWHTSAVTLRWAWDQLEGHPTDGNCDPQTFSADTAGTAVTCEVTSFDGTESDRKTVTIKVDVTAPTITAATPSRAADHDGWWNHPLDFTFSGSDQTSGIASCDQVTYSGPDGSGVQVTGSCHDVAGNVASMNVPFKYDSTPPSVTDAAVEAHDGSATVRWKPSDDVVRTEIARVAGRAGLPFTINLNGPTSSFADTGLLNGIAYDYTIRVFDSADNSSAATASGVPTAPPPPTAANVKPVPSALPLLRWHRTRGADYYNVQLFRHGRKILSAWPKRAHFRLARSWSYHGHRYRLTRDRYRWYVWPGFGKRAARRYGGLIRSATFYFKPGV